MSNPLFDPYEPGGEVPEPYPTERRPLDGVSVAAFVTSLTCCLAAVAIGLGIAGLVRTSGGRRSGRWAASAGLALGVLGALAQVAALVGLVWIGATTVPEEDAEAGQCVDTSQLFQSNDLWEADCDEEHDAEIIYAGTFDEALAADYPNTTDREFCSSLDLLPEYVEVLRDDAYRVETSTDAVSDDAEAGDAFACYVERKDDEPLTEPLVENPGTSTAAP